jgi:toxin FitB
MFILDTNVVSELRKARSRKINPQVAAWAKSVDSMSLYLSAITVLELEFGVCQMEYRDPGQGALLRAWLDNHVLVEFAERILPVDKAVAQRCGRLHSPDRHAELDAIIAATALVHGMTVVTRNVADFVAMGVPTLNPWDSSRR